MLVMVRDRTKVRNNDTMLINELNAAADEMWKRLYAVFPDCEITFDSEGTFLVATQQFNLGAAIVLLGGVFYGSKTFYIKGASDDRFIPVEFMDTNDPRFQAQEQEDANVLSPVYASLVNFDQIRFAPELPAGTMWRSDWIGKPPNLSLATNTQTSIPEPFHQAIVDYGTATVYDILDDDREMTNQRKADYKIRSAIDVVKRRQWQTPFQTKAYPPRGSSGYGNVFPRG